MSLWVNYLWSKCSGGQSMYHKTFGNMIHPKHRFIDQNKNTDSYENLKKTALLDSVRSVSNERYTFLSF